MILGKSNHPVLVKRISLQCWTLRDEIEQAVANLHLKREELGEEKFNQELLKLRNYYQKEPRQFEQSASAGDDKSDEEDDGMLQPEVGEVDDEMAAMAAALEGGGVDEESDDEEGGAASQDDIDALMEANAGGEAASQDDIDALMDSANAGDDIQVKEKQKDIDHRVLTLKTRVKPHAEKVSSGLTFLSDINMEEMIFFSKYGYTPGQSIVLEFLIPQKFILSARVIQSKQFSLNSKIISATKPDYRILAEFTFIQDGERTHLRNFLKSIEPEIPPPPKRPAKKENDDDDDEDLSDFGF
jgi:hypothetical protein